MTPRTHVALMALLLATVACTPPTAPEGGSNTTVNQNTTVNIGQGGNGASPSPGAAGPVAAVGIGKVSGAETCPVGIPPSGRGDAVKVLCTAFLTCSPRNAAGVELFEGIPLSPEQFEVISGQQYVSVAPHGSNPYNLDLTGRLATPDGVKVLLQCKVAGVTSPPFPLVIVP